MGNKEFVWEINVLSINVFTVSLVELMFALFSPSCVD